MTEKEVIEVINDMDDNFDDIDPQEIDYACFQRLKQLALNGGYGKQGKQAYKLIEIAEDILYS